MSRRSIPGGAARDAGHQSTAAICVDPWPENWAGNGHPLGTPQKIRKITLWRFPMIFGIPKIMNSKIGFSLINYPFWSILGYPFWETSTPHFQSLDAVTSMAFWGGLGLELSDQRTVGAQQLDEQTYPFSCG